jgi:cytochrome P450
MSSIETARFDRPDFYLESPDDDFAVLRESDPLHWSGADGFWVATKYDDIRFISSRPDLFPSSRVSILSDLIDLSRGREPANLGARGVKFMDPPEHTAHRKVVSVHFTPKAVKGMEGLVRQVIADVFDDLPSGEFDWIGSVAEPVPVFVFSRLLGVPEADWSKVSGWATTIANAGSGLATEEDYQVIFGEIAPFLMDLLDERRREPADDLLTMLTTVEVDGVPLDEIQTFTWAITLLAAGSETTQSLIAGMAACLDRFPAQADALYANPDLAGGAVEETLRWWTPVISMARQASTDVELRGRTMSAGEGVLLPYSSANRDEERWGPTAADFDIRRPDASNHLGFGFGAHFCIGAHLARREGRVVLEELCQRGRRIEIVGDGVPRRSSLVRTYDSLPVRLTS